MTDKHASQNFSENAAPQETFETAGDINGSQEQFYVPKNPPKALVDWLVKVNRRKAGLGQQDHRPQG